MITTLDAASSSSLPSARGQPPWRQYDRPVGQPSLQVEPLQAPGACRIGLFSSEGVRLLASPAVELTQVAERVRRLQGHAGQRGFYSLVPIGRGVVVVLRGSDGALLARSEQLASQEEAFGLLNQCVRIAPLARADTGAA